jgi:Ca2+-binding EF-hand superfamily protein
VQQGFSRLFNKSAETLYQDTLNHIYIESKQQDLTQTIYTIFTEIDELDGLKEGNVHTTQFVEAIVSLLGIRSQLEIDFEFLSLKYR